MRFMRAVVLTLIFAGFAVAACEDEPSRGAGTLTVTLRSPHPQEGGARIRLVGPGMISASAIEGEVHARVRGDTMGVLVVRPDAGVLRFALEVQDTTRKPRGALVQVVGPDNEVRPALLGYSVEVVR